MALFSARGLNHFISDIRACASKEAEDQRVTKELAKLRDKFSQTSGLTSYDKKKYSWKLIYIYILGYDIDFGHMQVLNLMSSNKYAEKCLGYLGTSILLQQEDELMTLVINSVRNDLLSMNQGSQCLALAYIANMGGSSLCEALGNDVIQVLNRSSNLAHVRKKAALTACRIIRTIPDFIDPQDLMPRISSLLDDPHLGVVTSTSALLLEAVVQCPSKFESFFATCIVKLDSLVYSHRTPKDYLYYAIPCPWLQITLLQTLQLLPCPSPLHGSSPREGIPSTESTSRYHELKTKCNATLEHILTRPEAKRTSRNNALYAVLVETMNVVMIQDPTFIQEDLRMQVLELLGTFIATREANIRYIGLDLLAKYIQVHGIDSSPRIKSHKDTVLRSLEDADHSVHRRALDVLHVMCDTENAFQIVGEMVNYLASPRAKGLLRAEMVLKIAVLAERFATDLRWYVDTIVRLISIAGAEVSDDLWHRVVQLVTNHEELQQYTASMMFDALSQDKDTAAVIDETTLQFGAYVLGEFGYLIAQDHPGSEQFALLNRHFRGCVLVSTKSILLTTFIKLSHLFEDVREDVLACFTVHLNDVNLELSQRASEYFQLYHTGDRVMKSVLEPMPLFCESALMTRLPGLRGTTTVATTSASTLRDQPDHDAEQDILVSLKTPPKSNLKSNIGNQILFGAKEGESRPVTPPSSDPASSEPEDPYTSQMPQRSLAELVLKPQGVLFENTIVQIGLKHEYTGARGLLNIFLGNKTTRVLTDIQLEFEDLTKMECLRTKMDVLTSDQSIGPKQQLKHQLRVECLKPFSGAVPVKLKFAIDSQSHVYSFALPIVITSFMEKVSLSMPDFIQRWKALEGANREKQRIFSSAASIDMEHNRMLLMERLPFEIAPIDHDKSNDTALSLVSTLRTGALNSQGNKISVGCLVRLEGNLEKQAYRLTVRAVHGDVSAAVDNLIVSLLS